MKKLGILVLFSLLVLNFTACDKSKALSAEEIEDLTFLREEEKLARDVYLYAYGIYNESIFLNISNSEQKHMDNTLSLLNKYDLPDPATSVAGEFTNSELQTLYDDLTAQVDISLTDAYVVGATIEDLDIHDIEGNIERTDKSDILNVYEKLQCGSRNHMRSFTAALEGVGSSYNPQYISQSEYEEIINSSNEQCGKQN
ncbi:MAG: DUF2202 domain-containing protein [Putridiphycobacter sp.]